MIAKGITLPNGQTYVFSGGGYNILEQKEPTLIVDHILNADGANTISFSFLNDDYPEIEECNEFLITIKNPNNKDMPYWRLSVNECETTTNAGGHMGYSEARLSLRGTMLSVRMSDWVNVTIANRTSGNISIYERTMDIKLSTDKIQKITIASYQKWLEEGANIKIYGWRI